MKRAIEWCKRWVLPALVGAGTLLLVVFTLGALGRNGESSKKLRALARRRSEIDQDTQRDVEVINDEGAKRVEEIEASADADVDEIKARHAAEREAAHDEATAKIERARRDPDSRDDLLDRLANPKRSDNY